MNSAFLHGVEVKQAPVVQPASDVNMSTIGIIGTAPYADPELWPLDTPVLVGGYDTVLMGALTAHAPNDATDLGTLPPAFASMLDECSPVVVAIRVEGTTSYDPATLPAIVGGIDKNGAYKGVHAFLAAESAVGVRPRLLCAPGYTHQKSKGALVGVSISAGGEGYIAGTYPLTISDSTGAHAQATVTIGSAGTLTDVTMTASGAGYSKPTFSLPTSAGQGTGAQLSPEIADVSNPVVAELGPIAERLRAVMFLDGPNTTLTDAFDSASVGGNRAMMIDPWLVKEINGVSQVIPPSAKFAALQSSVDQTQGFWCSLSNKALHGIIGLSRSVDFVNGDESCAANMLNSHNITTIIRSNGFKSWGNRALDGSFLCVQRTIDEVNEVLLSSSLQFVDLPINKNYLTEVVEAVNAYLRTLIAKGAITGGKCWADVQKNTANTLKNGQVFFNFDIGPAYPAERITFTSTINDGYVQTLSGGAN